MSKKDCKEVFFNRAELENAERICCDNCLEPVVFHLKDKNHEFSIGLSTILQCLDFAISKGDLPKLPLSWCGKVGSAYGVGFKDGNTYWDGECRMKKG